MKITILKPETVEVDAIRCVVPVRYDDEDMPLDYPHRRGDVWDVTFDVETGQIRDWPEETGTLDLHMRVTYGGRYFLLAGCEIVADIEEDYVPDWFPGHHYGDYLIFDIDGHGRIANWVRPRAAELIKSFRLSSEND